MLITDAWGEPVELDELDPAGVLSVLEGQRTRARGVERDKLLTAQQWCVLHPATEETGELSWAEPGPCAGVLESLPGVLVEDQPLGGEGTPAVAAFTAETFGASLGVSRLAAKSLLADALDLTHRLPRTWARVLALEVEPYKARRVAQLTRLLGKTAAAEVDAAVAPKLGSCSWAAIERAVAAAIAKHHPELIVEKQRRGRAGWDVTLSHPSPTDYAGTSWLDVAGDTLDLTAFHDRVTEIAAELAAAGDTDHLGARKAKALGILAAREAETDLLDLIGQRAAATRDPDAGPAPSGRRPERTPRTRLYLHLSLTEALGLTGQPTEEPGAAPTTGLVERLGAVPTETIRDWVRRSQTTITPVLDLDEQPLDDAAAAPAAPAELRARLGALLEAPIRDWVGPSDARVRPVLDLAGTRAVDGHEPPEDIREQVILRDGRCVFPSCPAQARSGDLDHIEAYVPPAEGGPPGQTTGANLAPLCRGHHRCKTARRWRYRRRRDGTYEWHGPHGLAFLVASDRTIRLTTG